jgi:UDP-GlcNAc:undecaprenyl-phosphate GlcNAc-1-phosphate transferase
VMLIRLRERRSPFSADRNHLHHKLLALGLAHREAVAVIYSVQAILLLLAYFMRFESDIALALAFGMFAIVALGSLRLASRLRWTLRNDGRARALATLESSRLPEIALITMAVCLGAYAATVLGASKRVGLDVGILCLAMLIVLLLMSKWRAERPLVWVERAVAYVSVVLLVYLDQTSVDKAPLLTNLSWVLLAVTGAAALMRFFLSPTRRFEVTALDLLVLILAFVLPNLPGSVSLPPQMAPGVAKAVILLYVVELLLAAELKRPTQRAFLVLTLAVIAARGLFAAGA